ncbi:hypothetical protein, partial [Jejuia pallidilutea]
MRTRVNDVLKAKLGQYEVEKIKKIKCVENLQLSLDTFKPKQKLLAKLPNNNWTYDSMGPFIIPKKGLQIDLKYD